MNVKFHDQYRVPFLIMIVVMLSITPRLSASSDSDDERYWALVLSNMSKISTNSDIEARLQQGNALRAEVVQRMNVNTNLAQLVRNSLRNDDRVLVRMFAAKILTKAFEKHGNAEDYIMILADPELDVRGFGILGLKVYHIQDAVCSLGANLLSKESVERYSALDGIILLLGWKCLPYCSALLYDSDVDVASMAAYGFRSCKREDAIPHLLRYLKRFNKEPSDERVAKIAIETLYALYKLPVPLNINPKHEVDIWKKKLELELAGQHPAPAKASASNMPAP